MNQQTPPCWQVAEHIDTGRLIRVLAPFERPPAPIQALFAPGRPLPPKFAPLQISWWRVERHRRSNARSSGIDRHHAVRHDEALFGLFSASCVLSPRRLNFVVEPIDYFAQFQPRLMEARLDVFDRLASYL